MKKLFYSFVVIGIILISLSSCQLNPENECELPTSVISRGDTFQMGAVAGDYLLLGFDSSLAFSEIQKFIQSEKYFAPNQSYESNKRYHSPYQNILVKLNKEYTCNSIDSLTQVIEQNHLVRFVHPTYYQKDCSKATQKEIGVLCVYTFSNHFNIQLKSLADTTLLDSMANKHKVYIGHSTNDWHTLYTDKKSSGNALNLNDLFIQSKLFKDIEAGVIKRVAVENK